MQAPLSLIRITVAFAAVIVSTAALAHPKLLSSTPADKAELTSAPQRIELDFSENLVTQFSGAKLTMIGMPGMADHAPMKIASDVSGSSDPKVMVITPLRPLQPGTYRVEWRAVSSDTHPINGNISFTVK